MLSRKSMKVVCFHCVSLVTAIFCRVGRIGRSFSGTRTMRKWMKKRFVLLITSVIFMTIELTITWTMLSLILQFMSNLKTGPNVFSL